MAEAEAKVALVVGATGLVGRELVRTLKESSEWKLVVGLARKPDGDGDGDDGKYRFLGCDLLDRGETAEKLREVAEQVTHLFWVTWASQFPLDTQECCDQNRAMLSNVLDALLVLPPPPATAPCTLRHVSLQTGTKHYVSLSDPSLYSNGDGDGDGDSGWRSYYHDEESPRVGGAPNFYYALEDLLKERLRRGVSSSWSVHRPGMLLGASRRSLFNIVGSLCVYGAICSHLGLPFLFRGDRRCWEEPYMDASDCRLVARQQIWWATASPASSDAQAFNAVNVTAFAWKEVWPALASRFGLMPQGADDDGGAVFLAEELRYGGVMGDMGGVWAEIVERAGLRPTRMDELANWWFLDAMFRFPGREKLLVRRPTRAHRLGFTATYSATESLLYWVDRMREERLIPYSS